MQRRITFLLILNMGIILASLGVISHLSVNASIERSLESRLALANIIGRYIDYVIESNLKRLYDISLSGKIDFDDGDWEPERKALKAAIEYSVYTGRIFLLDRRGHVVLSYPHREDEKLGHLSLPHVSRTLAELRPVVSNVYTLSSTQRKIIFAFVPLKNKDGDVVGVAGGEIDPTNFMLSQIIGAIPTGAETFIELIDSHGTIIASNDPRRILSCSDRYRFLQGLLSEKKAKVVNCHRCKDAGAYDDGASAKDRREKDMIAFAPLSVAPWGIIVRDPQEQVYSPSASLGKAFFVLCVISIVTSLLLSVGLSRSIVRPIRSLIGATRRIGEGNLADPVVASTQDEIGTLGRSFDEMRIRLAESLESVQRYSSELESRVADRTRELQQSRAKLAILLREIITAEEAERKRIARELHDDTSQSLNAILISIDSIFMKTSPYDPVRKQFAPIREQCLAMLKGLHRMIKDLRPPVLDDLGLESAIKWVLSKHIEERGIGCRLETQGSSEEMKARVQGALDYSKVELVLFRVVQEAIINISKHADAKNVFVSVAFGDTGIEMRIEDDGKGFDPRSAAEPVSRDGHLGLGLMGMEERISLLDGRLTVRSEPGKGTRIDVYVPVPAATGS